MSLELQILLEQNPFILPLIYGLFGLCIGSYLNVVIYRLPRGMSTSQPKHSFCPRCEQPIAWYHNIPVLSWLFLWGRSACCQQPISYRYPLVELATAMLMAGLVAYKQGSEPQYLALALLCMWGACCVVIFVMDWMEMVVLPSVTILASLAAIASLLLYPRMMIESADVSRGDVVLYSGLGMTTGFLLLKFVGFCGQRVFGRRAKSYEKPQQWKLQGTADGEDIELTIGKEKFLYSELMMESRDSVALDTARVSATKVQGQPEHKTKKLPLECIMLHAQHLSFSGGRYELEHFESLRGSCMGWKLNRSVLGSGDAWIVMAMGALCGWQGAIFCLFAGSIIGLIAALILRLGRGAALPFGPSLVLAALLWVFGAKGWIDAYLALFQN